MITKDSVLHNCEKFMSNKKSFVYRVCKSLKNEDFCDVVSSQELTRILNDGAGKKIKVSSLTAFMEPLLKEDIIQIKTVGKGKNKKKFWFPGWIDKKQVESKLTEGITVTEHVLPEKLVDALNKEFETELADLNLNYGKSGTCTAFLLRKILEKLLFLTFAKHGLSDQMKYNNGDFVGLKTMIDLATIKKVQGKPPFLMPKTAKAIEGIKFLGDTSAHNPLTNVDMKTIIPQMPFIITAYEELSKKL